MMEQEATEITKGLWLLVFPVFSVGGATLHRLLPNASAIAQDVIDAVVGATRTKERV